MTPLDALLLFLAFALPTYIIPELLIHLSWVKKTRGKEK